MDQDLTSRQRQVPMPADVEGGAGEVGGCGDGPIRVERAPLPRSGVDAEFAEFVAACRDDLSRTAWLLCGDVHQAEELVQEALVRTFLKWRRAREGEPLAYARRVLANLRIDQWRKRRRETSVPPEQLPEHPGTDEVNTLAERDRLVRALRQLPPRRRKIVVLRHLVGLPEAEVADHVGVSVGTVKSTVSRSLVQLRHILGEGELNALRRGAILSGASREA